MSNAKPLVSEQEWVKFCVRENNRVPRDKMPHCFGMPVLSLPDCNHLVGTTKNLCQIRQSCALAYAERLKIDTAKFTAPGNQDYPALVDAIRAEEARIRFVPELGKKAPALAAVPQIVEEEVTMASILPKEEAAPKVEKIARPARPPAMPKVASSKPTDPPIRTVILTLLASFEGWVPKSTLIGALEKKLNRSPLNSAVLHKVSLVLLPKSQAKYGYTVEKQVEKVAGRFVYSYKLTNGPAKSS